MAETKRFNRTVERINELLDKIDEAPDVPMVYRGEVIDYADLPENPNAGDCYLVSFENGTSNVANKLYYYSGSTWKEIAVDGYTKHEIDTALAGKQDALTFDTTPTSGSTNPVTSDGIYNEFAKLQLCTGIFTEFVDALPAGKHIVYCNGNASTNGTPEGYMLMHVIKYAAGGTNAVLAIGKSVITNANLYTINRSNSGWGSWYRYVGTAV